MRAFNYDQLHDQKWDSEIVGLVAQIHEYKGRQEIYLQQKPAALDKLIEIAKVQSTEDSNRIEGIVTTSVRLRQLLQEKTTPRNRDEQEIMGYRDVLNTIHENYEYIPIRSSYILQLHRDLYKYSERSIGGRFKNVQNYITETKPDGTQIVRFTPLPPYETEAAIDAICDCFNRAVDAYSIEPLILIPVFINDFLCIHPFNDGNGRMSRLLTTLLLYRLGYVVGRYISLESKIASNKDQYYDVLETSGEGWHEAENDPSAFIKYLLSTILAAYRDFEDRVSLVGQKVPALEMVRGAVMRQYGKFTKRDIMERCPTLSRASVENSLSGLTDEDVIVRHGKGRATYYVRKDADHGAFLRQAKEQFDTEIEKGMADIAAGRLTSAADVRAKMREDHGV
ncbi:MAG TPA: Fic family protein [Alphaproteobacteria bacterium]|nr:Fic family protein [Alphaproteobacteria bacterium]